jgi:hypothetical protein
LWLTSCCLLVDCYLVIRSARRLDECLLRMFYASLSHWGRCKWRFLGRESRSWSPFGKTPKLFSDLLGVDEAGPCHPAFVDTPGAFPRSAPPQAMCKQLWPSPSSWEIIAPSSDTCTAIPMYSLCNLSIIFDSLTSNSSYRPPHDPERSAATASWQVVTME